MKKIILSILVFIIVFLIYYFNIDSKIYYLSMGDYLSYGINNKNKIENSYSNNIKEYFKTNLNNYVNYSKVDDYRVMDLINDINNNIELVYNNNEYKIQNLLVKSNFITISIGMNDLIYKKNITNNLTYDYIDELLNDIDELLKLVRKYNKDKIYFLSFYDIINESQKINYANNRLKLICKDNNVHFVNINNLNKYIPKNYPTNDGYTYITDKILDFTK